jgi:hypothetical protein
MPHNGLAAAKIPRWKEFPAKTRQEWFLFANELQMH